MHVLASETLAICRLGLGDLGVGCVLDFFGKVSEAFENTNTIHLVETVPLPVVFLSVEDLLHETVA